MLRPRHPVPDLDMPLTGSGRFVLSEERPQAFTMIVVYRGLHCPICKTYLRDLNTKVADFAALGVNCVAASSDTIDRASQAKSHWGLDALRLAFEMSIEQGRRWGLFVSRAISEKEPAVFLEPGLFLVRPDLTLYASSIQTMPFTRPSFDDLLRALQKIIKTDYPARGEV